MPNKCKHTVEHLQAQSSISGKTPLTDLTDSNNKDVFMDSDDDANSHQTSINKYKSSYTNADRAFYVREAGFI